MYTAISVLRPGNNAGTGAGKYDKVTFVDLEDVLSFPSRDSKGIVIEGNIVMKPGKYAIEVYGTVKTMEGTVATTGEPDNMGFEPQFVFKHPGSSVEIREFAQNWLNRNVAIAVKRCGSNENTLYGAPCSPMQIMLQGTDNDTENSSVFTVQSVSKTSNLPADYRGTFTYETPKAVVAAGDATPSVLAGSGQYQLTDNAAPVAITDLEDAAHGGVYSLLGSGGANPSTIASAGKFLLKDGVSWTASAGSQITFRAFKSGSSSFTFIEQSRI
jgi:hypothetical protein